MFKVEYDLRFQTSVYHACEAYGNLYVAGSLWDRRSVLYTKQIAAESEGVLRILRKSWTGFKTKREIVFPYMVYTVTDLLDGRLFVALKYSRNAFTLIDQEGNIYKTTR